MRSWPRRTERSGRRERHERQIPPKPPSSIIWRRSGTTAALLADAEARLAEEGVETAWLACAIGNERAARFYEKCGWRRTGTVTYQPDASDGAPLEVWHYEKRLR